MKMLFTVACVLLGCVAAYGQSRPATAPATDQHIADLVRQLGDDGYHKREVAQKSLRAIGKPALAAIRKAANSSDAEIAVRAKWLLDWIRYDITPDSPVGLAKLVRQYAEGAPPQKHNAIRQLSEMGMAGIHILLDIAKHETDKEVHAEILLQLGYCIKPAVTAGLLEGKTAEAELLMEGGIAVGEDRSIRAYAAYLLVTGGLDAKIRQLEAKSGIPNVHKALAYLYRATGNLKKAQAAAEKSADDRLRELIALERSDWKTVVRLYESRCGDRPDAVVYGHLATYHRLAGNREKYEKAIENFVKATDTAPDPDPERHQYLLWSCAKVLLLNNRVDEAIKHLRENGSTDHAFDLLVVQSRYAEALALAKVTRSDRARLHHMLDRARLLHMLGRHKDAHKELAALLAEAKEEKDPTSALIMVADIELDWGMKKQALGHWREALAMMTKFQSIGSITWHLYPNQSDLAALRWKLLCHRHPDESRDKTFARLDKQMKPPATRERLVTLIGRVGKVIEKAEGREKDQWLESVIFACREGKHADLAKATLVRKSKLRGDFYTWRRLGDLLAREKHWRRAAECYRKAWKKYRRAADILLRYGRALSLSGNREAGEKWMMLARLLPLDNVNRRRSLARVMVELGLDKDASGEYEIIVRTGNSSDYDYGDAMVKAASLASRAGKHFHAADLMLRARLCVLQKGSLYLSSSEYIGPGVGVHVARMKGHLAAKQFDEAAGELNRVRKLLPGDIEGTILLVNGLDKAGEKRRADAVFAKTLKFQAKLSEQYPNSGQLHDSMAWLAARCRRRLDDAMVSAKRAVQLEPTRHQCIDTLAEVHFQRGERKLAIALMIRCIELSPDWKYYVRQMKRFRTGDPSTSPLEWRNGGLLERLREESRARWRILQLLY